MPADNEQAACQSPNLAAPKNRSKAALLVQNKRLVERRLGSKPYAQGQGEASYSSQKKSYESERARKLYLNIIDRLQRAEGQAELCSKDPVKHSHEQQLKVLEKDIIKVMTDKASEIDPYLHNKCFVLPSSSTSKFESACEQGNLLHYLCATGFFPGLLDFILRKKCRQQILDKNELTEFEEQNGDGQGSQSRLGSTALHLACANLK